MSEAFFDFYKKASNRPPSERLPAVILGFDPGETTGLCICTLPKIPPRIFHVSQLNTSIIEWGVDRYSELISEYADKHNNDVVVVAESYRIYSWRVKQHTWSSLLTPRLVGCIETLCRLRKIPLVLQSAQTGKAFVTDERLKQWDLYKPGMPHANDATRHVCTLLLFGDWKF